MHAPVAALPLAMFAGPKVIRTREGPVATFLANYLGLIQEA